ncbi:Type-1 fimbrial protein, A chain precursor [compost metagenome]
MKLKTLISTAVTTVLGAVIILPAQATDGTITFTGSVTATTCTIGVDAGGPTATVTLPVARLDQLRGIGSTTGATTFNIRLSACQGPNAQNQGVAVHFEAGTNVNADGRLSNTAGIGRATGVDLEIRQGAAQTALVLGQVPAAGVGTINGGIATLPYTVRYHSTSAAPTAGTVSTSATYAITYF